MVGGGRWCRVVVPRLLRVAPCRVVARRRHRWRWRLSIVRIALLRWVARVVRLLLLRRLWLPRLLRRRRCVATVVVQRWRLAVVVRRWRVPAHGGVSWNLVRLPGLCNREPVERSGGGGGGGGGG